MLWLAWVSPPQQNYPAPKINNASAEKVWSHSTTLPTRVSSARHNSHPCLCFFHSAPWTSSLPEMTRKEAVSNLLYLLSWVQPRGSAPHSTRCHSLNWECCSSSLSNSRLFFKGQLAFYVHRDIWISWSSHPAQSGLPLQPVSSCIYLTVVIVNLCVWLSPWCLPFFGRLCTLQDRQKGVACTPMLVFVFTSQHLVETVIQLIE